MYMTGQPRTTQKLWNSSFVIYLLGSMQSSLGSIISGIALSFVTLEITKSAGATGLTLALSMVPNLLGPFAGTLVDRISLRIPLIAGDILRFLLMLGVWYLATHGDVQVGVIYAVSFLNGLIGIFYTPATEALLPSLVPEKDLARANGILGATSQVIGIGGYAVAGVLVSQLGAGPSLLIDAISFLIMGLMYLLVEIPKPRADVQQNTFLADFKEGWKTLSSHPLMKHMPMLGFVTMAAMAPLNMMLPKIFQDSGSGATGFGVFMTVMSVGMLLGSLSITALGDRFRAVPAVGAGLVIYGACYAALSFSPALWMMWGVAFLFGAGMSFTSSGMVYLLQVETPREQLGRVFGMVFSVQMSGMPLTLLLISGFADRLQQMVIFLTCSGVLLLLAVFWMWVSRRQKPVSAIAD